MVQPAGTFIEIDPSGHFVLVTRVIAHDSSLYCRLSAMVGCRADLTWILYATIDQRVSLDRAIQFEDRAIQFDIPKVATQPPL